VNRLTMLVTADGEWVLEDSTEFRAALGDLDPDYDAASFAVKNLGFIKIQSIDNLIIEIELHPRNVELPALLAVQQHLLSSQVKLFRIKYFDLVWHSEITCSSEQTIARLAELCCPKLVPQPNEKFIVEPRDYSALFDNEESQLRPMLQKWRMSFACFDSSVISLAIQHQLLSRMAIVGVKPRQPDPVFRFIGDGFKWLEHDHQLHVIGQKVEDLPDKDYGMWVAEFYKSVAAAGQPRADYVIAQMHPWPHVSQSYITRYERLLLPWKTPSGEVFVTSWSQKLDGASLSLPSSSVIKN
jgi:hypothetical protein